MSIDLMRNSSAGVQLLTVKTHRFAKDGVLPEVVTSEGAADMRLVVGEICVTRACGVILYPQALPVSRNELSL